MNIHYSLMGIYIKNKAILREQNFQYSNNFHYYSLKKIQLLITFVYLNN